MSAESFVDAFKQARASAIVRTNDQRVAADAMEAAVRGGFRMIEFTLTIPGAFELIEEFSRRPGLRVGAGTVLSVEDARRAVRAGAECLVSPVFDERVVAAAAALDVAAMPGVHTATELFAAHRSGAQLQKLFPAPAGGPAYVRSVLGPLPFLNIVPTNGVDVSNAGAWLDAGAVALGFVTALFDPTDMQARAFDRIERRASEILAAVA
ncbi:MAG: 2-dehydro-3-deoxyphosphogluconate aldolase [Myxococcales bacterium FL481]|nr:MAG: 2-dehydro-3-deoxyphosphogluconate aldolase [Myxococcales bacterium FL481]